MTNLQFGTYVFEHNPRKISMGFESAVAAQLLPSWGVISQNMGARCRLVRCEGEVFAATPDGAAAKLAELSALCVSTAAMLYLPTGERFSAYLLRFGYAAQGDGRVITYTMEFTEAMSRNGGGTTA